MNQDLIDQLDRYIQGTLTLNERTLLEEKIAHDATFKQEAMQHIKLIESLQQYGNRAALKLTLDAYHEELIPERGTGERTLDSHTLTGIKKYWPMLAVAAAVSIISVMGTLLATTWSVKKQKADYKELRKNVEQIKKSQKAMMADLKEVKEKDGGFTGNYEGTGFLISSNGYVATSYHVVRGADSVYVENKKFGRLKATLAKVSPKDDIAILKIEETLVGGTLPPYTLYPGVVPVGEGVFTLGFPREDIVYGEGTISAASGYGSNEQAYQISVPVNPGNSGGPLLNKGGQLVGIVSGLQTETQGAAFAIKSSVLLHVVGYAGDSLAVPATLPRQNKLKNLNRVDQIRKIQDYVFVVKAYNSK